MSNTKLKNCGYSQLRNKRPGTLIIFLNFSDHKPLVTLKSAPYKSRYISTFSDH